jgi:hypothetical protein
MHTYSSAQAHLAGQTTIVVSSKPRQFLRAQDPGMCA